jgi:hypothetical protein
LKKWICKGISFWKSALTGEEMEVCVNKIKSEEKEENMQP